jgi:hypothetical protein
MTHALLTPLALMGADERALAARISMHWPVCRQQDWSQCLPKHWQQRLAVFAPLRHPGSDRLSDILTAPHEYSPDVCFLA